MSERMPGWYWIKLHSADWICGCWHGDKQNTWGVYGTIYHEDEIAEIANRIPSPDELEGWRLVPVDPTPGMQVAGVAERYEENSTGMVYKAMICAAPRFGDEP